MLNRLVAFIVVAVSVWLLCMLAGSLLPTLQMAPIVALGQFLARYAVIIGFVAGLAAAFSGWSPMRWFNRTPPPA